MYQIRQVNLRPVAPASMREVAAHAKSNPVWLVSINAARANLGLPALTAAQLDGAWRNNNDQR